MKSFLTYVLITVFFGTVGCRVKGGSESSMAASASNATVVAIRVKSGNSITLSERSKRSLVQGVVCRINLDSSSLEMKIVPRTRSQLISLNASEYFVEFLEPIDSAQCDVGASISSSSSFAFKDFFVQADDVELLTSESVAPYVAPSKSNPSDLTSRKAEALAADIERRRTGGGKACGLTAFGSAGCWACVGWSMTDVGIFPSGLGSDADGTPNGFLRATANARSRKAADGTITINNVRFKSLKAEFGTTPSLAPRGSILFCNTSAAGHAAIITQPANEMRSDVVEVLGVGGRQSLCWERVDEILFPLD